MPRKRKKGKRKTFSVEDKPVIQVDKNFLRLLDTRKKIVYFIRGDKSIEYPWEHKRSCILYIGTTKRKGRRPFETMMARAPRLLRIRGMKSLDFVYVKAPPKKHVDITKKLEKAFLHQFRGIFGKFPKENVKVGPLGDAGDYVHMDRVGKIILKLSHHKTPYEEEKA